MHDSTANRSHTALLEKQLDSRYRLDSTKGWRFENKIKILLHFFIAVFEENGLQHSDAEKPVFQQFLSTTYMYIAIFLNLNVIMINTI